MLVILVICVINTIIGRLGQKDQKCSSSFWLSIVRTSLRVTSNLSDCYCFQVFKTRQQPSSECIFGIV